MSAAETEVRTRSLRVLVADDSLVHQTVAVRLLEADGHRVAVANNGQEALALLRDEHFDVLLMDVQMPEMDGLTAARAIRQWETGRGVRLPIIAVTSTENRAECLAAGMDAFLTKPLNAAQLQQTLQRLVQRFAA